MNLFRDCKLELATNFVLQKIKKNYKVFAKVFEAKDRVMQSRVSKEILDKRRSLIDDFMNYRQNNIDIYQDQTPYRRELRNGKTFV